MLSLHEYILEAKKSGTAIGHFNISTIDGIWAVADAAEGLNVPVIIGVSEGERDYIGVREAASIVRNIRQERDQPIFINADHSYSFERVQEAVDAGYDAVIFDGAKLSLEDNIKETKRCIEYIRNRFNVKDKGYRVIGLEGKKNKDYNPITPQPSYPLLEGELGYIGRSSQVLVTKPEGIQLTDPADAKRFADETGIDMLAPAVGNFHGLLEAGMSATLAAKKIDHKRIQEISESTGLPLVLHGGSGQGDDDVRSAIKAGVAIVHINTELRVAYRTGLMKSLSDNPDEVAPYKYMKPAKLAMQAVVERKLKVFNMMQL